MYVQVDWKLNRGKWRPKLLDYAKDASEQSILDATKSAFASLQTAATPSLQHVEEALKGLTSLKVSLLQLLLDTFPNTLQCLPHTRWLCFLVSDKHQAQSSIIPLSHQWSLVVDRQDALLYVHIPLVQAQYRGFDMFSTHFTYSLCPSCILCTLILCSYTIHSAGSTTVWRWGRAVVCILEGQYFLFFFFFPAGSWSSHSISYAHGVLFFLALHV